MINSGYKHLIQVRDEHRDDFDDGRGGWGAKQQAEDEATRAETQQDVYATLNHIPEGSRNSCAANECNFLIISAYSTRGKRERDEEDNENGSYRGRR